MSQTVARKDFYKILRVSKTASKHEIKNAYRKMAMALHPDRHDGCEIKADEFKQATEAYATLSDHDLRKIYDNEFHHGSYNKNRRKPPPANYRKVYSPRPPPGFKTFDAQRHYDMHYGNGIMEEEIKRARMRAEAASTRSNQGYDYVSPLGKGFTFSSGGHNTSKSKGGVNVNRNPYSKYSPQGPPSTGKIRFEYEEAQIFGLKGMRDDSIHNRKAKETVKSRMETRRKQRRRNRGDPSASERYEEDSSSCTMM